MQTDELREFLVRMAEESREPTGVPPKLGRRAARRRARTVLVGIVVAALLGYGGFSGVHALTRGGTTRPAATTNCSWNVVDSPNRALDRFDNGLHAVTVVSDDDAWAVGWYTERQEGGAGGPLLLHWDGTAWNQTDVPAMDGRPYIQGVAAISSHDVWAVGYREGIGPSTEGPKPLALHWDGAAWTMVPAADPGTLYSGFTAVAGTSSDDVWAVGFTATGEKGGTLAEHWDGSTWTVLDTPSPPPDPLTSLPYPRLDAVTAIAPDDVWAAGARENVAPMKGSNTLVLHWDGDRWSVVPTPDVPSKNGTPVDRLVAVSASGPDDVWAAGSYAVDPDQTHVPTDRVLVLHWDGTGWTVADTPPTAERAWAEGIAATSPSAVSVVGGLWTGQATQPLVERWDGARWTILEPPVDGWGLLSGAQATPSGDLWGVGNRTTTEGTVGRTLTMRCS